MKEIIDKIKKASSGIFQSEIYFTNIKNTFILQGNSQAINIHNGNEELVNSLHWFDNFYIYITIHFIQNPIESKFNKGFDKQHYFRILEENYLNVDGRYYNVLATISVFQGGEDYESKRQLFRAEWDNYGDNKIHPQPHWHFYPEQKVNHAFGEEEVDIDFLKVELQKEVDLKRMHFAMNGQWSINGNFIHRINSREAIINWFPGILSHIKNQLRETKRIVH